MGIIKQRNFWLGMVAGVIVWQVVLPRVAPGLKAKMPV